MNFDRNTVIGFVVLALLFMGYFYFNSQQQSVFLKEKQRQDSIAKLNQPKPSVTPQSDTASKDSTIRPQMGGEFQQYGGGSEQLQVLENDLVKVVFTNKGGQPKSVELKKYKTSDSTLVKLAATDFDQINYTIIPSANTTSEITSFYFTGNFTIG